MPSWALSLDDTIAAISTPPGQGAVGIVRMSGPQACAMAERLFVPSRKHAPALSAQSHRLTHGWVVSPATGAPVDEVLAASMLAPHSYTGEDVVEFQAHGGSMPLQAILRLCLLAGARAATPGEFTLRAFVNGRLDLAQAEAVMDVITAQTDASLRVASRQLEGKLSHQIRALRTEMIDLLAYCEARIDFVDDEIAERDVVPILTGLQRALRDLLAQADRGIIYRRGVRTAIVGRPNVGKSSLLNRLLRQDRAIVTPIAGTTRDTLSETVSVSGVPFVLVDTAGINKSDNPIERLGVERSHQALAQADLILLVVDGSQPPSPEDTEVASLVDYAKTILVRNKADLSQPQEYRDMLRNATQVTVSALTGQGIDTLEQAMLHMVSGGSVAAGQEPWVSNPRHKALLQQAHDHVTNARHALGNGATEELLAIDISEAIAALGEITGEDASDDLLATIFARFCVGK